jgi:NTE family protein
MAIDQSHSVTEPQRSGKTRASGGDGTTGIFDSLPDASRRRFEEHMTELRVVAGELLFEEGDPGDALFLVRTGLIDITSSGPDGEQRLVTFGPGELFGEMALLTGRPRIANARAQTDALLWRLHHTDFVLHLGDDPALAHVVAQGLSQRLRASTRLERGTRRGRTVLVHGTDPELAAAFGAALLAACAPFVEDTPLVLACDDEPAWTHHSLDPPAVVTSPADAAGEAVRAVRERSLVLVVSGRDAPPAALADGADWHFTIGGQGPGASTRARPARHFATMPDADGIAAIAREVCGRRVGLALGAGGIRGWAHAGVFEVLMQEDIPVDIVSGASAGAVAGALFVAGMPADAMMQIPTIGRDVLWAMRTYRPSPMSILSGRPFMQYLRDRLGNDAQIEDLPKPMIIAVTDLGTRSTVYLTEGPLPEAIVASAALNGIFPPVRIGERTYVDGGASDPVPVGVLREAGADIVIAVNVMAVGEGASGFIPRGRIPIPGFVDNLLIGLDTVISQSAVHSCKLADVTIEPDHSGKPWHEVFPAARYAAAGARATREALPQIRALLGQRGVAPRVATP